MSYYLIEDTTLTNLGNAVRSKTNTSSLMSIAQMITAINNISTGGSGDSSAPSETANFISYQIEVSSTTQGAFVTLLSNNSFVAENYNNSNLFVILTPDNLDAIDTNAYSSAYQWTCMFAGNKAMTASIDDIWYGMGIYLMLGKNQSYPSTLEIPYSLNDTSNTNYSYLNATENGDIRAYICSYDVLASGSYTVSVGLLN